MGQETEKELIFCEAIKGGGDCILVRGEGQIVFESEMEEPMFIPATLPILPDPEMENTPDM